jgi:methylmalonyl-CoA mutase, N-terminal domain
VRADAAEPDANLMPGLIHAVATRATVGEIVGALADVFGRYREDPVI